MEELLEAEEKSRELKERRIKFLQVADANELWAGMFVGVLILVCGVGVAFGVNAATAGQGDNTTALTFGLFAGGVFGWVVGMLIFSQRRLQRHLARRTEQYFNNREKDLNSQP